MKLPSFFSLFAREDTSGSSGAGEADMLPSAGSGLDLQGEKQ